VKTPSHVLRLLLSSLLWLAPLLWLVPLLWLAQPSCLVETEQPQLEGHDVKVTFIHTSDVHSRLLPYSLDVGETDESLGLSSNSATVGGAARASTIIKRIRSGGGRVVHIDTGDVFQGAPIFNQFKGEVEFKWLNMLGVDAFVIGNHEFDAGIDNLVLQARQFARFPMLNANYGLEDPNVFGASELASIATPYTIINAQGLRIGVIGLGSLSSIVSMYEGGNSLGITPMDTIQMTQFYVDFLRPLVDVVVVASHLGLRGQKKMTRGTVDQIDDCEGPNCTTEQETARCSVIHRLLGDEGLIRHTEGIDLVLGGHLHIVINPPELIQDCDPDPNCAGYPFYEELMNRGCQYRSRKVPLMHSGAFLKFVGQLDVVFHQPEAQPGETEADAYFRELNAWEVKTYRPALYPVDDTAVPREQWDVAVERLLEPYSEELFREIQLTRYIAYSPRKIRRFATGYGDSELGNLVSTSMQTRNRVEAQFAITNTLGIRADINRGPITEEMMYNVFPFENAITTMTLSGREVKDVMDYVALRSARRGCQLQAQVSGITALIDCNADVEAARRVTIGGSRLVEPDRFGREAPGEPLCSFDGLRCTPGQDCAPDLEPVKACPASEDLGNGTCCPEGELCTPLGCGAPIAPYVSYKLATNDYIATGGSGFTMLEQNTTQFNTGISLRDSVMDYVNAAYDGCGAALPQSVQDELGAIAEQYDAATWDRADYDAVIAAVLAYYENANTNGHANYGACVEDLGGALQRDCDYLEQGSVDRSRCRATTWLRAGKMCIELPCVMASEDGRLNRIFPE